MKYILIIGTDTDCGKTYATAEITSRLNEANRKTLALKPIATGCGGQKNGTDPSEDASLLNTANPYTPETAPWRYDEPVSLHIAANNAGASICLSDVAKWCFSIATKQLENVLIESAGGLMAPINDNETWLDFAKQYNLPVIVVVGMRLGCLNHAQLTLSALDREQITVLGWIANCIDPNMLYIKENINTLKKSLNAPFLGEIPYGGKLQTVFDSIYPLQ